MRPLAALALAAPAAAALPGTGDRIRVFDDQLGPLSPALVRFAATHYAGSQKLTADQVDALRAVNPDFFMIQYRLALGLGYRATTDGCRPNGDWLAIVLGRGWVREWPAHVQERWLSHRDGRRILNCDWGWYLTNPDDPSWRARFTADLARQIRTSHADGAFLDSASVPSYLGGASYSPRLPGLDLAFERAWSRRLERWLRFVRARTGRPVIANAGSWVTTRDPTDYSVVDGVMIEGYALGLAPADWALQQDRVLGLVRKGRIVIAQAYPEAGDVRARMLALGSYLLVKGGRTYVNLETGGFAPAWFPEYDLDLGAAAQPPAQRVEQLREQGAYVRRYQRGLVVVNPDDTPVTYRAGRTYSLATPSGGGAVPTDGRLPAAWKLERKPVSEVVLGPGEAAVLLTPQA